LIAHGADVNATDNHGDTALKDATNMGKSEMIKLLKEAGAKQ
jgi:ankyrin repeat protein